MAASPEPAEGTRPEAAAFTTRAQQTPPGVFKTTKAAEHETLSLLCMFQGHSSGETRSLHVCMDAENKNTKV